MIRLDRFELKNFRSCAETDIKFDEDLTALIGINGAGKTNILNGLLLMRKLHYPTALLTERIIRAEDLEASHCSFYAEFDIDKKKIGIKFDLWFEANDVNAGLEYAKGTFRELGIKGSRWKPFPEEWFQYAYFFRRNRGNSAIGHLRLRSGYLPSNELAQFAQYCAKIHYYSATQFSDPSKSPVSFELDEDENPRSRLRSTQQERFLTDLFELSKKSKSNFRRFLDVVGKDGVGLVDKIQFLPIKIPNSTIHVQTGGSFETIENKKKFVIPIFTIDGLQLSPNQLSEGTFKTLALIFHIMNDDAKLLLIEEPEVCVHHGLLRSLIELLIIESRRKQIVISTHSDYVLDLLDINNVVVVERGQAGTEAHQLSASLGSGDLAALRYHLEHIGSLGEYWKETGFGSD